MKRNLAVVSLLVLSFVGSGCEIISISPPPDVQGTSAAATSAAQPTLPSSPTSPPSATAIMTPSPTPSPSLTVGPSLSPTPTELPADDPRRGLDLSAPHFVDNFSVRFRWGEPHSAAATIYVQDGQLHAIDRVPDPYIVWSRNDLTAGNFYAEVTAEIDECAGRDGYGLAVRINGEEANNAYTLEFSCSGEYRMRVFRDGGVETLLDWTAADSINKGTDGINRMGFLANGSDLYAFANRQILGQVRDTLHYSGTFGLFASAAQSADLSVDFDEFTVWYINP
jgi:hypothetical protein